MKGIFVFLGVILAFVSCEKAHDSNLLTTGNYSGTFTANYAGGQLQIDTIELTIVNDRFQYTSSNSLNYGEGRYIFQNDSLEFFDEVLRYWLHSWDWILNGKYTFRIHKDTLIMEKNNPNAHYKYNLLLEE